MDIATWLRELGLERYEAAFRDNEIDAEILPTLSADDLSDLGVTIVGHRRKLLNAIAALSEPPESTLAPVPTATLATEPRVPAKRAEAERRQLTVLFCDLVGSTAMSARLDPEEMREVIRAYQSAVAGEVARFEGHVAKYMGDGVLAYFGYPKAHEDDAERAVRAGLAIKDQVRGLAADGQRLSTRIGIATGRVVVGDLIGEGAAQEEAVVGETPNLAARLQALAQRDSVVIAPGTRHLLGGLFELADLGVHELKGFSEPVRAWRVVGAGVAESRFEALHGRHLIPLVGREEELHLLLARWRRAAEGEGQVVLLSGEAGIGKSRIVQALRARLADQPHMPLSHYCSPYHTSSALYPVISLLERAAGLARDDTAEARLDKLEALLVRGAEALGEAVPLVAALLGIATGGRYAAPTLSPQRQKQRTLEVLVDQVEGLAAQQPVLAVYEDVHWVDPTTLELLGVLIERVQRLPVLVSITFRPEFDPPWTGHAHVMQLSLSRLTRRHGQALVGEVTGRKALPDEVLEQILAKTDGVPLFVEELTKTVLESGLLADAGDRYELSGPLPPLAIPATLRDSLMARLDRPAPVVKEVAQTAAVIGREFSHDLLAAVSPLSEADLSAALDQLIAAELIFRRGAPPAATYSFKHALVQDAAYHSLLRSGRRQLHAQVAGALQKDFPGIAASEPEALAHHYTQAGFAEAAIDYWSRAGELAIRRSANLEAISHLGQGLECVKMLPEGRERDQKELTLQSAIGTPLIAVHGYSASQTGAAYGRARLLCERLGDVESLVATLSGAFVYSFVRGDYPVMRRLVDEARRVTERWPDPVVRLAGHRLAGIAAMHFGAFAEARCEFEAILRLYDARRHRSQPVHYVHDPKVSALTYLALVLWILGFPEQACRSSVAAFRCAAELDQANLTAHVHNFAGAGLNELLGNVAAVGAHADAIVALADRHNLGYWRVNGLILRGWAMAQEGAAEPGLALMRQSVAERAGLGVGWYQARYLCMLAAAHAQLGEAEPGLRVLALARALAARNDEHMWEGELDRIEGELLQVRGASPREIEARFARALAGTRRQGAKSLELRAAASLARLWAEEGKQTEARDLLAPLYGWFTEGFETADLKAAKALLDELS